MVTKELIAQYRKALPGEMPQQIKNLWHRYFLKRNALMIGIGGLISIVSQFVVYYALTFITSLVPRLFNIANGTGWQAEIYDQLSSMVIYLFTILVPYLIVAKLLQLPAEDLVAAQKPRKGSFLPMLMIGLGSIPLLQYFAIFTDYILSFVQLNTPDSVMESAFTTPDNPVALVLYIILLCVMAPLFEEFAFRGVVMQSLRRYGDGFAVVASALLFGIMHANTAQTPFAFVMGLVLGYVVVKTNSIWTAVAIHAANNSLSTLIQLMGRWLPDKEQLQGVIVMGIWALCFIIGIIGVILYVVSRYDGRFGNFHNSAQKSYPATFRTFISSPTILVFLALNAVMIFMLTQLGQDLIAYLISNLPSVPYGF